MLVMCNVEYCIYNKSLICTADYINVFRNNAHMEVHIECSTFMDKKSIK